MTFSLLFDIVIVGANSGVLLKGAFLLLVRKFPCVEVYGDEDYANVRQRAIIQNTQ